MARLIAMYKTPHDVAAFAKYYFEKHVPLAKTIPGLKKYEVSQGPVTAPFGASDYHLIAILHFDDVAAIQNAFTSAPGQAARGRNAGRRDAGRLIGPPPGIGSGRQGV